MRILITAGPTREALDPVRYLTNRSSGRMGYAIAEAAAEAGHEVLLVSGPVSLAKPAGVEVIAVESARQMFEAVQKSLAGLIARKMRSRSACREIKRSNSPNRASHRWHGRSSGL